MSKRTRRRIYNRVAMMFRRRAESLGVKNWKWEVKIDGLRFEEYLDKEIKNYDPETAELTPDEVIEEFRKGILGDKSEEPKHMKTKTDYEIDPQLLRLWNRESEEQREQEIKRIADAYNENVEEQIKRSICPICRSSVCRCRD